MAGGTVRLRCPACLADNQPCRASDCGAAGVGAGALRCRACDAEYDIVDGIPMLFVNDHTWRDKQRESDGWEAYNAELGQMHYEGVGAPPVDFAIPYIEEEPWASIGRNFDLLTEGIDFDGKSVLDIGAGRPWAAKNFALRGAVAAAMDVNAHPVVGLGRGREMMQEAGVTIELFVGDSENLPVASGEFDFVFISAAMHHTNFLRRLAREMHRVLKPGGVALIANEPTRSAAEDEADLLLGVAEPELRHGITERRPSTAEYVAALADAGFTVTDLFLGEDAARPDAIWERLTVPVLIPPRQEWLDRSAPGRFYRAFKARWQVLGSELELRSVLPRNSTGVRQSHARPDINIRAAKSR